MKKYIIKLHKTKEWRLYEETEDGVRIIGRFDHKDEAEFHRQIRSGELTK